MKESRVVEVVDIVNDKVADHHYKESEDLSQFTSSVTGQYLTIDNYWSQVCYKNKEIEIQNSYFELM